MKTIIKEEQCLVCKGTGQRSWLYRYWDNAAVIIGVIIIYTELWDTYNLGWKIAFIIVAALSVVDIIFEKNKNKRGKCKNCNGTGKIILEEVIEEE